MTNLGLWDINESDTGGGILRISTLQLSCSAASSWNAGAMRSEGSPHGKATAVLQRDLCSSGQQP